MTDQISIAARASAERLVPQYGQGITADVEAALHSHGLNQRPEQYLDPISLGSLIVAIASLAWSIYSDQRKKTPEPSPDVIIRRVRVNSVNIRRHNNIEDEISNQITEIVVNEVIQASQEAN